MSFSKLLSGFPNMNTKVFHKNNLISMFYCEVEVPAKVYRNDYL
jgi:hypothetical protein